MGLKHELGALEKGDGKYRALQQFLANELKRNPREKFVIFAFYRGTLKYLARRLKADGINAALIMGDMGKDKDDLIRAFARSDGPSVGADKPFPCIGTRPHRREKCLPVR